MRTGFGGEHGQLAPGCVAHQLLQDVVGRPTRLLDGESDEQLGDVRRRSVDGLAQCVGCGQGDEGGPLPLVDEQRGLEATVDLLRSVNGEP